jgi:cobalamin biosynthesis protein CobD/CbiB
LSRVAHLNDRIERLRLELIVSRNSNKLDKDEVVSGKVYNVCMVGNGGDNGSGKNFAP